MRRSRERRRLGDVCVSLEVGSHVIVDLVALGCLSAPDRADKDALSRALVDLIERAMAMRVTRSGSQGVSPLRATDGPGDGAAEIVEDKPPGTRSYEIDPVRLWAPRLDLYTRVRMWMNEWGPRPDRIGCQAPESLLDYYGLRPSGVGLRSRPGDAFLARDSPLFQRLSARQFENLAPM
jgi:hypothetical protein